MAKISRNAPCPCGSGQKYKRCCLPKDQAAAPPLAQAGPVHRPAPADFFEDEDGDPTELSNRIVDLIDEGNLEEAEEACAELQRRFPEIIDWMERRGMLCEARGERPQAIEYYQQCLAYIDEHQDLYDEGFENWYVRSIDRLNTELNSSKP